MSVKRIIGGLAFSLLLIVQVADAHKGPNNPPQFLPSDLGVISHNTGFFRTPTSFSGSEVSTGEFHGFDQDGDTFSFNLRFPNGIPPGSNAPEIRLVRDNSVKIVWNGPKSGSGNFYVTITVVDSHQASKTFTFYFPFTQGKKPEFRPIPDQKGVRGTLLTFPVELVTPDAGIQIKWDEWKTIQGAAFDGKTFSWTPSQTGSFGANFEARRDGFIEARVSAKITVEAPRNYHKPPTKPSPAKKKRKYEHYEDDPTGAPVACGKMGTEAPVGRGDIEQTSNEAHFTEDLGDFTVNELETVQFPVSAPRPDGTFATISPGLFPGMKFRDGNCLTWTPQIWEAGDYDIDFLVEHTSGVIKMPVTIHVNDIGD